MNTAENESSLPAPTARRAAAPTSSVAVAAGSVAPVGRRVAAFALDSLVVLVAAGIGYVVLAAAGPSAPSALRALPLMLVLGVGAGQWIAEARSGATVGSALLGIRTLSAATGRPAGLLAVLVRNLVIGLGALACWLGQWVVVGSGAWDRTPAQRGWHDKAAGTVVLRAEAVRRSAGHAPAVSTPRTSTAPRPVVPADGARERSSDPVGLVPPVTSLASPGAPLSVPTWALPELPPAVAAPPPPVIEAGPDRGAVDEAPAADPPPSVIHALPDDGAVELAPAVDQVLPVIRSLEGGAVEQAPAVDPLPPVIRSAPDSGAVDQASAVDLLPPVIDTPVVATVTPTRRRRDRAPALDDPAPLRSVDPDLSELEHTRLRVPAPEQGTTTGLRLLFDTGEQLDVTGDGLVGRNPGPDPGADHVVAIDDPERSISKVHLAFGLEADGRLWVMDRGSTNGTVVVGPDGRSASLVAGSRATVSPGWIVQFGRRTVQVTQR